VEQFEREVERALARLDSESRQLLDGALVVVVGAPGAEVVADGVDPRVDVLLDLASDGEETKVVRIFVYQQNVERAAGGIYEIEDALVEAFSREIVALKMGVDELRTV
jgi:hypothetical protein